MKQKILIADDEPLILKALETVLVREGYEVIRAENGQQALDLARQERPELVLLDLMMPELNGFEVCTILRQESTVPILILSAKGEEVDKVMGFTLGSDDYIVKPFSPTELVLRIKAVLRRSASLGAKLLNSDDELLQYPGFTMNRTRREVVIQDRQVELTVKEFDLLWLLASHPKQVFTREQLIYQVWQTDFYGDTNAVNVLIKRLREKIEQNISEPEIVKTVRGLGYKFGLE